MYNVIGTKLVCFEDGYYTVFDGEEYELLYGNLIVQFSELNFSTLKDTIISCPFFYESVPSKWEDFKPLSDWLKGRLLDIVSPVISNIIFFEIFNFIHATFIDHFDCWGKPDDEESNFELAIKEETFRNTDYDSYGADTIGHLLITALCNVASVLVIANGALKNICEGKEEIVMGSISPEKWENTQVPCQFTSFFGRVQTVYIIGNLDALLLLELSKICENKIRIKKCQNCGRYFIPESRTDEIYCNRISPQNNQMSCKEYGSKKLWYDKLRSDEIAKLSRNIYMAKQMLVKRNPDIIGYKDMFEFFKKERKKWEKAVKGGSKTRDEYVEWLNSMKVKKVL